MANGMPTEEQDKFMNDIAFKLKDALEADKTAYLTSIYTGRNSFFMIFYTSSVEKFARILHQVLAEYEQLPLQIGKADDPQWEEYTEMLEQNNFKE